MTTDNYMTIDELYEKLCSREFQDTAVGSMFYNVYIYQFPAEKEYEIRRQTEALKKRLKRPNNSQDILMLDIFDEFCAYLDQKTFGKHSSMLNYLLDKEKKDPASVQDTLIRNACDDKFFAWIHGRITSHLENQSGLRKSFIFLYGFGQMYPYLRTNTFLSNYERYNVGEEYKLIVFYPGHAEGNSFSLFGRLRDDHTYRSIKLINQ